MRVLMLGGTGFVGRHMVEALLASGHEVNLLNRGHSPVSFARPVERLLGDRDAGIAGLAALRGRAWDACVDVSGYTPRQVRPSAESLGAHVGRYLFVSAVSVYGDPRAAPVDESCARMPPAGPEITEVVGDAYGALKVACEDVVTQVYGMRCTLLRPQVIAGAYDPIDRLAYWVRRAAQPGPMLAPGDGADHLQFIDARDVASFVVTVLERDLDGAFNLAGPRLTWAALMSMLGAHDIVWVPANVLEAVGLTFNELPLYRRTGSRRSALMDVDNSRAREAGLTVRPAEATIDAMRTWLQGHGCAEPAMTRDQEAGAIDAFRNRQAPPESCG